MDKESVKRFLEELDVRPLMERVKTGDVVFVVGTIVLALIVGVLLGYNPFSVLEWLGL